MITLTKSQQRLHRLIALKRPLTDAEQDELYRALHADYMRRWRASKAIEAEAELDRYVADGIRKQEEATMRRVLVEAGW